MHILATLLNNGTSPPTSGHPYPDKGERAWMRCLRIIFPHFPAFGRKGDPHGPIRCTYTNIIRDFYCQPREELQGWGLRFMLAVGEAANGIGKNGAWWAGEFWFL